MSIPPAKCDIQSHRHIFSLLVRGFVTDKPAWRFQENNKHVRTNILPIFYKYSQIFGFNIG